MYCICLAEGRSSFSPLGSFSGCHDVSGPPGGSTSPFPGARIQEAFKRISKEFYYFILLIILFKYFIYLSIMYLFDLYRLFRLLVLYVRKGDWSGSRGLAPLNKIPFRNAKLLLFVRFSFSFYLFFWSLLYYFIRGSRQQTYLMLLSPALCLHNNPARWAWLTGRDFPKITQLFFIPKMALELTTSW